MRVAVGLLGLAAVGSLFSEGLRAYRDGRFADAAAAFAEAEQEAGGDASAQLLVNLALAALNAGQPRDAERAAEKAAVRGGAGFRPLRDFLLGNAAFLRCERAEAEAGLREADPTAFDQAIRAAEAARDAWIRAAVSREDWPAARRNVERASRKLDELRREREEAERERQKKRAKAPQRKEPEPERQPDEIEQEAKAQQDTGELTAEALARLLERLGEKDREKRDVRRARQLELRVREEKDW